VFHTRVGDKQIEDCDFVRCDDHGLVTELHVMVRPLSGAIALAERMQERLGLSPGRGS
jgi:hypothetical protein